MTTASVTTLVPGFKVRFLNRLIRSLSEQTLQPRRIIISDDTPDGEFGAALLRTPDVRSGLERINGEVVTGPRRGYHNNVRFLIGKFREAPTDFLHIHLDDDQLFPSFYADHMDAHNTQHSLCCVSRRLLHEEGSEKFSKMEIPLDLQTVSPGLRLISLRDLVSSFIRQNKMNWVGELSCCTLRREFLDIDKDFNALCGIGLEGANDIGTLFKSSISSPLLFLSDPRSIFSLHGESISGKQGYFYSLSILVKVALCIALRKLGKINLPEVALTISEVADRWLKVYGRQPLYQWLVQCIDAAMEDYAAFETEFLDFWTTYKSHSDQAPALATKNQMMLFLATYRPGGAK